MNSCKLGGSSLAISAFATSALVILASLCLAIATTAGCSRTERVLDVETPGAEVEVDRNIDTGEVTVDVNEN